MGHTFKKIMNRPLSIMGCEYWDAGERIALPSACDGVLFFDPLFIYDPGHGVGIWYDFKDTAQSPELAVRYFSAHKNIWDLRVREFKSLCSEIYHVAHGKDAARFIALRDLILRVWPVATLAGIIGAMQTRNAPDYLIQQAMIIAREYDQVVYVAGAALIEMARVRVPEFIHEYLLFLKFEEIETGGYPDISELENRKRGFIYFRGELDSRNTAATFVREHDIVCDGFGEITRGVELYGCGVGSGTIRGRVKVVFEERHLSKVEGGDIIVSPMTIPDFMPAVLRSAGMITDEGGATCHAALVARELHKPCIVGTHIATQQLQDGDFVEINSDDHLVRIIG